MSLFGRGRSTSPPKPQSPRAKSKSPSRGSSSFFGGGSGEEARTPRLGPGKKPYADKEAEEILKGTVFDKKDLATLGEMYRRQTTTITKVIPVEKMRDMPETSVFPLFQRVCQMHNTDNGGFIEFKEFVQAMSALSPKSTLEEKLKFTFKLFDMGDSGTIDGPEIFQLLRMTMGLAHSDASLQAICDQYMQRFPDGMTYEHFVENISYQSINKLVLPLNDGKG